MAAILGAMMAAITAIILVINKSTSRFTISQFCNHSFDFGINITPLRSITYVYITICIAQRKSRVPQYTSNCMLTNAHVVIACFAKRVVH